MPKLSQALQIIVGYDFGYFTYKSIKIKRFIKSIFLFRCLVFSFAIVYDSGYKLSFTVGWVCGNLFAVKHLILGLFFTFIRQGYTFCGFESEIREIDKIMKCESAFWFIEKRKASVYLLHFLFRLFSSLYLCIYSGLCLNNSVITSIFTILGLGFDTILVSVAFVFYSVYHRFVIFESYLKSDSYDLLFFHHLFKALADVIDKFNSVYEPVNLLTIVFNVPLVMIAIYDAVWMYKNDYNFSWLPLLASNTFVVVALLMTLMPAFLAEKISRQTTKIKNVLYDRVLFETDETKCRDIEKLIACMEARPLKFTVYKVIPLDAKLLAIVFHFCVTYLIVIIQFAHLY